MDIPSDSSLQYNQTILCSGSLVNLTHWKSIEHKLFLIKSESNQSNILAEYERLDQTLVQLNACSDVKQYLDDPGAQNFFFERFLPAAARAILRSKVKYSHETQYMLNNCLRQMIQLWLKTFSDLHRGLFEMAAIILDRTQPYYRHNSSTLLMNEDTKTEPQNTIRLSFFEELLNSMKLVKAKIFDRIYEMVSDTKNQPSVRRMALLCSIIGNITHIPPPNCARFYINMLHEALCNHISQHSASYEGQGHFTVKNLKELMKAYKLLFERSLFSNEERHKAIDELQLRIAKIYLVSRNKEIKGRGFRFLEKVFDDVENPTASQVKGLSRSVCNKFLQDILKEMLGNSSFEKYMLINSPRVFLYLSRHELLERKNYRNFWFALKGLFDSKYNRVWYIIRDIFRSRNICSLMDYFFSESILNALDNISLLDFDVIRNIYSATKAKSLIVDRIVDLYCVVLLEVDSVKDLEVFERAYHELQYTRIGVLSRNYRLPKMEECISNLERDITKFPFLRILYLSLRSYGYMLDQVFKLFMQHMKVFREQNIAITNVSELSAHHINQYSERLECLKAILNFREIGKYYLPVTDRTYDMLNEAWNIFTEPPFSSTTHRDLFLQALHQVAISGLCLNEGDFARLFRERILNKETLEYLGKSEEGADCFQSLFISANHNIKKIWRVRSYAPLYGGIVVKVVPEELEGFEELWNLILSSQDRKAARKAIELLAQIYCSLEDEFEPDLAKIRERLFARCFEYIKSQDCTLKCIEIMSKMIEETGKGGFQELDAHATLKQPEILELTSQCESHYLDIPEFQQNSNSTVLELMKKIAKELRVEWEAFNVFKYTYSRREEILSSQNNKTLSEIGFRKKEHLKVKINPFAPRVDLYRDYDALSLRAIRAFKRLFDEYSDNGKMSVEQFRDFYAVNHRHYPQLPNSYIFEDMFATYDLDKDGYLSCEEFLKLQAAKGAKAASAESFEFFKNYKLRHDLRDEADIARQQTDKTSLVSNIILSNGKYFDTLLSLLDCEDEEKAGEAWTLLNQLPTHPQVFGDVVLLKGVRGIEDPHKRDWDALIGLKSKYKLLYVLNIVEYLMYYNENSSKIPHLEDLNLTEYQRNWAQDFIGLGGLDHLSGIFGSLKPNESNIFSPQCRRVLLFAKAMNSKLNALLSSNEELTTNLSSFITILSEYQNQYRTLEHAAAAKLMSRSMKLLKKKRKNESDQREKSTW